MVTTNYYLPTSPRFLLLFGQAPSGIFQVLEFPPLCSSSHFSPAFLYSCYFFTSSRASDNLSISYLRAFKRRSFFSKEALPEFTRLASFIMSSFSIYENYKTKYDKCKYIFIKEDYSMICLLH